MKKPKIGITTGDINGIGLEVILDTLRDPKINNLCTPIIYGSSKTISIYKKAAKLPDIKLRSINNINDANAKIINIMEVVKELPRVTLGEPSAEAGLYAFQSLKSAGKDLQNNLIDAMVTAPVDKSTICEAIKADFKGQTEFLENITNNSHPKKSLMLFVSERLKLGLITNHTGINHVSKEITAELIISKATILYESLKKDFWISAPKIALLGLNPHSGDRGLLGKDEENTIKPAIEELTKKGIMAHGPFPADSFFARGLYRSFDATLAMYHDQGLIPFKLITEDEGVNFTAGLDFIRTSPTHGVAYNIAGQGTADTTSFKQAIYAAIDISRARTEYIELSKNPLPLNTSMHNIIDESGDEDDELTDDTP